MVVKLTMNRRASSVKQDERMQRRDAVFLCDPIDGVEVTNSQNVVGGCLTRGQNKDKTLPDTVSTSDLQATRIARRPAYEIQRRGFESPGYLGTHLLG